MPEKTSVSVGKTASSTIFVMPRGSFAGKVRLSATGLPAGVTASFSPEITTGASRLTLTASNTTAPMTGTLTIDASSGENKHTATLNLAVTPILKGTVAVDLSPAFNVTAIYRDGAKFSDEASADEGGYAFPAKPLGDEQVGDEVAFRLGSPDTNNAVASKTVALPGGSYGSLRILATAVGGTHRWHLVNIHANAERLVHCG